MNQASLKDVQRALRVINMTEEGRVLLGYLGLKYGFMASPIYDPRAPETQTFYRIGQRDLVVDLHRLIEFDLPDDEGADEQEETGTSPEDDDPLF